MIELVVLLVILSIDIFVFVKLRYALKLLRFPQVDNAKDEDLPSVSVCISARNETHAMTQCLERVVATEYPKLEIIVLDDGSRDNTSLLIKSFAHAGVRFVEGKPLSQKWLGKNYAQMLLAEEASGKLVFFMDVDTLIDRYTIRRAVTYIQAHSAGMISIVPIRNDSWQASTLMTTMRYFWTLMRFSPRLPRAVSNAWIVERQWLLDELAKNKYLQTSLQMETLLARSMAKKKRYRLVLSNLWLGLRYEKRWSSQTETSVRLLYPQSRKSIWRVIVLLVLLGIVFTSYVAVIWYPWMLVAIAAQYLIALYYLTHIWSRYRIVGALLLPLTIFQEIVLLIISTYRYKRGTVTWKGRPVTNNY